MATPVDLARLADYVQRRRIELHLSPRTAAAQAGISRNTWTRVENGEPVRAESYKKIEDALGWATGSCVSVGEGQEPVLVQASQVEGIMLAELPPEKREDELRTSVELSFLAVADSMTAAQIRELSARVVEDLKKRGKL